MLQVGIIGCGGIIERRHLPGLLELKEVSIVAMSDVSEDRVNHLCDIAEIPPSHRYVDYNDLLNNESLDVLIVATPINFHEGPVIAAAGIVPTVLVEKPLTSSLASAERMLEAHERSGTSIHVVHNQIFRPAVETAMEVISNGNLGNPFLYRDEQLGASHRPGSGKTPDWRTKYSMGGGGCLIDNAYHSIYLAEKLLGSKVKSINALTDTFTHKYDVEDTAILTMSHHNGGLSSIQASWAITAGRHVAQRVHELHGTKGSFIFDYDGTPLALFHKNQESFTPLSVKPERNDDAGYYNFRDQFFDAVLKGNPPPINGMEGYHILSVVDSAYKSAIKGESIEVPK